MIESGKLLVIVGSAALAVGFALWGLGRAGFRGLPGDVRYETDHVRFYFPIVTCLVLSLVFTVGFWIVRWVSRR